jgi:hypothetical protein
MDIAGEADEALRVAGFVPCGELDEGSDDEDGNIGAPPHASFLACGGAIRTRPTSQSTCRTVPIELWSSEKDKDAEESRVGFTCAYDMLKSVFYAKLQGMAEKKTGEDLAAQGGLGAASERSMKGAITTLLDVAEACNSQSITLGLSTDQAQCVEFLRSLLFLGFKVLPSCKSPPLPGGGGHSGNNAALLLDFSFALDEDCLGYFGHSPGATSSDDPGDHEHGLPVGTSECSTSAEDSDESDDDGFLFDGDFESE